ncbi:MAG: gfo/Idh/MocA family oxidoreductase [Acidobacteria bacterium]|nr:MAG: gfo/Idh/MocA family oxidoreductase [Acidobacteriota bacterium]
MQNIIRWGIVGCGNVTEVKSGPAFQKASRSELVAVMRRDGPKAADYALRHVVKRVYTSAAELIEDPYVDAVDIATPPSSHCELALRTAEAGKACLVEKPMAMNHAECTRMVGAFREKDLPLFVACYRRALPRFLRVRELLEAGAIGRVSSVHITQYGFLASGNEAATWRFDPAIAGAGLFYDLASHGFDLLDFLLGPIAEVSGYAVNTGGTYAAEDVTTACFRFESGSVGTGVWNFNADHEEDQLVFTGGAGTLRVPVFADGDILVMSRNREDRFEFRNPPHVHQPLVQSIVDCLLGGPPCESTGESGARASRVLERCVDGYYKSLTADR